MKGVLTETSGLTSWGSSGQRMHRRRHPKWLGVRASDIPNADVVKTL